MSAVKQICSPAKGSQGKAN